MAAGEPPIPHLPAYAYPPAWGSWAPELDATTSRQILRCAAVVLEEPRLVDLARARERLGAQVSAGLGLMCALPGVRLSSRESIPSSSWRRRCTVACLAWRICPQQPYAAIAAGMLHDLPSGRAIAAAWSLGTEVDAALAGDSRMGVAVRTGLWLARLKRIGPREVGHPDIDAATLRALGLDASGLVALLVDLSEQADRARRLSTIICERR